MFSNWRARGDRLRLAAWLANGTFSAAAIDAPFSVPWWFFGQGFADHPALLAVVNGLPLMNAQDFPTGNAFVAIVSAGIPFEFSKPLRITDGYILARAICERSVYGLARSASRQRPSACACIKLLANANRQAWPWAGPNTCPLVEAYPAAQ